MMMSPNQFAELITHTNSGTGTPLTLEYVDGDSKKRREQPPFASKRQEFMSEMSDLLAHRSQGGDRGFRSVSASRGRCFGAHREYLILGTPRSEQGEDGQ